MSTASIAWSRSSRGVVGVRCVEAVGPVQASASCQAVRPVRRTPFTRRIPAASSGLKSPASAASYATRRTAASRRLIVDGAYLPLLQMDPVPEHDRAVEGEPRLRAVPRDKLPNRVVVGALATGGRQAVQYRRFGLFEVRQGQNPLRRSPCGISSLASATAPYRRRQLHRPLAPAALQRTYGAGISRSLKSNRAPRTLRAEGNVTLPSEGFAQ